MPRAASSIAADDAASVEKRPRTDDDDDVAVAVAEATPRPFSYTKDMGSVIFPKRSILERKERSAGESNSNTDDDMQQRCLPKKKERWSAAETNNTDFRDASTEAKSSSSTKEMGSIPKRKERSSAGESTNNDDDMNIHQQCIPKKKERSAGETNNAADFRDASAGAKYSSSMKAGGSVSPKQSILKKKERSADVSNNNDDAQPQYIPKNKERSAGETSNSDDFRDASAEAKPSSSTKNESSVSSQQLTLKKKEQTAGELNNNDDTQPQCIPKKKERSAGDIANSADFQDALAGAKYSSSMKNRDSVSPKQSILKKKVRSAEESNNNDDTQPQYIPRKKERSAGQSHSAEFQDASAEAKPSSFTKNKSSASSKQLTLKKKEKSAGELNNDDDTQPQYIPKKKERSAGEANSADFQDALAGAKPSSSTKNKSSVSSKQLNLKKKEKSAGELNNDDTQQRRIPRKKERSAGETSNTEYMSKKKKKKKRSRWDAGASSVPSLEVKTAAEAPRHQEQYDCAVAESSPSLVSPNESILEETERSTSTGESNKSALASLDDRQKKRKDGKKKKTKKKDSLESLKGIDRVNEEEQPVSTGENDYSYSLDGRSKRRNRKKFKKDSFASPDESACFNKEEASAGEKKCHSSQTVTTKRRDGETTSEKNSSATNSYHSQSSSTTEKKSYSLKKSNVLPGEKNAALLNLATEEKGKQRGCGRICENANSEMPNIGSTDKLMGLKGSYFKNFDTGASPTPPSGDHMSDSKADLKNILATTSNKNLLADAAPNVEQIETANQTQSKSDEKLFMDHTEPNELKSSVTSKRNKDIHDSLVGASLSENDESSPPEEAKAVNSSQSKFEPTSSELAEQESTPTSNTADPAEEEDFKRKRKKKKKKKKRKADSWKTKSTSSSSVEEVSMPTPKDADPAKDYLEQEQANPPLVKKKRIDDSRENAAVTPLITSPRPKEENVASSRHAVLNKQRKKDFSPFRVKVGCVVSVRFRKLADGGNSDVVPVTKDGDSFRVLEPSVGSDVVVSKQSDMKGKDGDAINPSKSAKKGLADESNAAVDQECSTNETKQPDPNNADEQSVKEKRNTKRKPQHYEVWSDPIPGQDDGLSLLGSWIRCAFRESYVAKWQKKDKDGNQTRSKVEGNVISILDNDHDCKGGISVGLLIDRSAMNSRPYLQVLSDDSNDATISASKEKRRKLESKIRGETKVVVRVDLATSFEKRNGLKLDPGFVPHWAIRKRVSAIPVGKKPSKAEMKRNNFSMFIGDGNDDQPQQGQNWRWLASRTSFQLLGTGTDDSASGNVQDAASQLVGEVIGMDVSPTEKKDGLTSLATVTIKRLWTPEHTEAGRLVHHGTLELFDCSHDKCDEMYFQAPIEDLIVIGKCINRHFNDRTKQGGNSVDDSGWNFDVTHTYGDNTYSPLCEDTTTKLPVKPCYHCQRLFHDSTLQRCQPENEVAESLWCVRCLQLMTVLPPCDDGEIWKIPCGTHHPCKKPGDPSTSMVSRSLQNGIGHAFSGLVASLESKLPIDFTIPNESAHLSLRPSFLPKTGEMKSKSYSKTKEKEEKQSDANPIKRKKRASCGAGTNPRKKLKPNTDIATPEEEEDDKHIFKPVCNRIVPFDRLNQRSWGSSKLKLAANEDIKEPFFRENARPRAIKIGNITEEKTVLTGRAARASQRRMFKSLAALGDATVKVDRLAGRDREQQLRFDKSQIHGWGVFTEDPVNAGDMIIEYRGEIIGNAVADKRELEYQKEKLDDYMFRIDAYTICDATILGNVARYINSSCSPNCYPKIVTAGQNKRIVVYAKRDICKGEELTYDYKFSPEYDPAKRIPCHCGALDCHGFMNWDKKYL